MRVEGRVPLYLIIRVTLPLLAVGIAGVSGAYYRYGPRPLFFVLLFGVPLAVVIVARLIIVRRGAQRARRVKQRVEGALAAIRRARRHRRVQHVELAAMRAAEDDALLSPERVRTAAESLFRLVQSAWNVRDRERLATLLGPALLAEWEQRLACAERNRRSARLEVVGDVHVEYVGFSTDETGQAPRVVVLIEAVLAPCRGDHRRLPTEPADLRRVSQYWTLGSHDGAWTVLAIDERSEGKHHLSEPIGGRSAG